MDIPYLLLKSNGYETRKVPESRKLPLDYFAQIHVQEFLGVRFFAPLLAWVLSWWQGTQLAIALDATTLGDRFVALAISVVYRGCAIPVAWVVLEAGKKKA